MVVSCMHHTIICKLRPLYLNGHVRRPTIRSTNANLSSKSLGSVKVKEWASVSVQESTPTLKSAWANLAVSGIIIDNKTVNLLLSGLRYLVLIIPKECKDGALSKLS